MKKLKRDDIVTLNITAADALKIYSVVGKLNGNGNFGKPTAWAELKRVLNDQDRSFYDEHIYGDVFDTAWELTNYASRQRSLERAFFDRKTEEEVALENLEKEIQSLAVKATELREIVRKQKEGDL